MTQEDARMAKIYEYNAEAKRNLDRLQSGNIVNDFRTKPTQLDQEHQAYSQMLEQIANELNSYFAEVGGAVKFKDRDLIIDGNYDSNCKSKAIMSLGASLYYHYSFQISKTDGAVRFNNQKELKLTSTQDIADLLNSSELQSLLASIYSLFERNHKKHG